MNIETHIDGIRRFDLALGIGGVPTEESSKYTDRIIR